MMIHKYALSTAPINPTELAELAALVQFGLGRSLDKATFLQLALIQSELRSQQQQFSEELEVRKIGPEEYLTKINRALDDSMRRSKDLLGKERFQAIFGDAGSEPEALIDRETFLNSQSKNSHY